MSIAPQRWRAAPRRGSSLQPWRSSSAHVHQAARGAAADGRAARCEDEPRPAAERVHGRRSGHCGGLGAGLNSGTGGVDAVPLRPRSAARRVILCPATVMRGPDVARPTVNSASVNAGFTLSAAAPGWYDISAYAHSVVSGTFTRCARACGRRRDKPAHGVDTPTMEPGRRKYV